MCQEKNKFKFLIHFLNQLTFVLLSVAINVPIVSVLALLSTFMVFDGGLKTGASFLITLTVTVVVDCRAGLPLSAAAMVTYEINGDIS